MKTTPPPVTRLADYRPPAYRITETTLTIDLDFSETKVSAQHRVHRCEQSQSDLVLDIDPDAVRLGRVSIDGAALAPERYRIDASRLIIADVPKQFDLAIENTIAPDRNTALSGLYQSGEMLCTQCEAEGFRRITPAIDRPDNLARYTVTLRADAKALPLLLCNGNLIDSGGAGARHHTTWHDPFPKPTYLFAIVAGKLACMEDRFTTASQRDVALRFFARARDIDKCAYAMAALKRAMAWDEKTYGREYDLDLFNVVAVGDFNMGAMENKSLNIFNTQYVLADPDISTDVDFEHVEAVIGHEYFHNWSGNRVTCRDWFQLSLKEGLTVFREQQFSADMGSAAVKRIEDVAALRDHQFPEDAGPMAHPVRPDSYIEINNFYTATVYHKGAEVIRMLHTLLGAGTFRRGADLYFARHDGQAATTDDFVAAMESAGELDLSRFKRWYSQAGTPVVDAKTHYDAERERFEITLSQHCPATPKQPHKEPFVIPIKAALFDRDGKRMTTATATAAGGDDLLVLSEPRQSFVFEGIPSPPVASLLRGFSAPVELRHSLSERDLALLLAHDDDPFNRWEAGQRLFFRHLLSGVERLRAGRDIAVSDTLMRAFESVLEQHEHEHGENHDRALQAKILTLPSETYFSETQEVIDPALTHRAHRGLRRRLATAFKPQLLARYRLLNRDNDGTVSPQQIAARSLRDVCLGYLVSLDDDEVHALAADLLANARCMTDASAALSALANSGKPDRQALLDDFYHRHRDEPLVVDRWLRIQATVAHPDTVARVSALTRHAAFDPTNPNKVYALILAFCHANLTGFHRPDGAGYRFAGDWVARLDPLNPQVAARLVTAFTQWKKYTPDLKAQMQTALKEIADLPSLSGDVAEIVSKSLEN